MILDGFLMFSGGSGGVGNADGATDSPTTGTQVSSNVLDLHGTGLLPTLAASQGARDMGIGDDPSLKVLVLVTVAFTVGTNIIVNFQGAPDNGSGAPGSYSTFVASATVTEANLVAGARIMDIDVPRPPPGVAFPRFLRLQYVTTGIHSTGKLEAGVVLDRHDQPMQANATLGGYPAGINIAN